MMLTRKNSSESTSRFKIVNEISKANSTVCIINDFEIVREKIYSSFKNESQIEQIVKTSKNDYIEKHMEKKFDVIVTDIEFIEGINTLFLKELCLNNPKTKIVVYTSSKNRNKRIQSVEYGADFFIFMNDNLQLLELVVKRLIGKLSKLD